MIEHGHGIVEFENCGLPNQEMIERFLKDPNREPENEAPRTSNYREGVSLQLSILPEWKDINTAIHTALGKSSNEYHEKYGNFISAPVRDNGYRMHHYAPGEIAKNHWDGGPWQLNIFLSCVIYHNTLKDGALCFPNQSVQFTPREDSMLLFPSHWMYPHYSEASKQDRFVTVTWLYYSQFATL